MVPPPVAVRELQSTETKEETKPVPVLAKKSAEAKKQEHGKQSTAITKTKAQPKQNTRSAGPAMSDDALPEADRALEPA